MHRNKARMDLQVLLPSYGETEDQGRRVSPSQRVGETRPEPASAQGDTQESSAPSTLAAQGCKQPGPDSSFSFNIRDFF